MNTRAVATLKRHIQEARSDWKHGRIYTMSVRIPKSATKRRRSNPYGGPFEVLLTERAVKSLNKYGKKDAAFARQAEETLQQMAKDLFHKALFTKALSGNLKCIHKNTLFECRVNIHRRVYWCYDPDDAKTLVINDVGEHL